MIPHSERLKLATLINTAILAGARKQVACQEAGISIRTLQRWSKSKNEGDQRPEAVRPPPVNKLTDAERKEIIEICCELQFVNLPPSQIVPILADSGVYIASESSFYRVLKDEGLLHHRGRAKPRGSIKKPTSHVAGGPNKVWSWDISYLPTTVIGQYNYLYMIEDIYSRKIVGWEVHHNESGELASELLERAIWSEKCVKNSLVLHSDNGSPMKSLTLLAKMYDLGVMPSRSRPRVSNDNPFSESLFRTVKYCPQWPSEGFACLEDARSWVARFVGWYNNEHRHSRINFVTPAQRHRGEHIALLRKRQKLYAKQKQRNPNRWSGTTRNWTPIGSVDLNPERTAEAA